MLKLPGRLHLLAHLDNLPRSGPPISRLPGMRRIPRRAAPTEANSVDVIEAEGSMMPLLCGLDGLSVARWGQMQMQGCRVSLLVDGNRVGTRDASDTRFSARAPRIHIVVSSQ
jgi:hypothetical protein